MKKTISEELNEQGYLAQYNSVRIIDDNQSNIF